MINIEKCEIALKEEAESELAADDDDFCIEDYIGNNTDDAFWMGVSAGRVWFARKLLNL